MAGCLLGPKVAHIRVLIGLIAVRHLWIPESDAARRLNIDRSAVCHAVNREEECEELICPDRDLI